MVKLTLYYGMSYMWKSFTNNTEPFFRKDNIYIISKHGLNIPPLQRVWKGHTWAYSLQLGPQLSLCEWQRQLYSIVKCSKLLALFYLTGYCPGRYFSKFLPVCYANDEVRCVRNQHLKIFTIFHIRKKTHWYNNNIIMYNSIFLAHIRNTSTVFLIKMRRWHKTEC